MQPEAFIDQALQARAVDYVVGEFLAGKHAQGGAARIGSHLRHVFRRQIWVLADHRHDHADHHLQAAPSLGLFFFPALIVLSAGLFGPLNFHAAPVHFSMMSGDFAMLPSYHCGSFGVGSVGLSSVFMRTD